MTRIHATLPLISGLLVLNGCESPGPTLEDVIQDYLDLREQRVIQQCECYPIYIDLEDMDPFASEQECLDSFPLSTGDAVGCIKEILKSSVYDTEGSIKVMQCYNSALRESAECHAENIVECSATASNNCTQSDIGNDSLCQGMLSEDEASAIIQCAVQ